MLREAAVVVTRCNNLLRDFATWQSELIRLISLLELLLLPLLDHHSLYTTAPADIHSASLSLLLDALKVSPSVPFPVFFFFCCFLFPFLFSLCPVEPLEGITG